MATHLAVFCVNQTCEKMLSNLQRNWPKSLINRLKSQTHCQGINKPTSTTRSQICQNMWKIQKITFVNKYNTKNKSNTISRAVQKNACLIVFHHSLFRPGGYVFLLYTLCAHTFFFFLYRHLKLIIGGGWWAQRLAWQQRAGGLSGCEFWELYTHCVFFS